MASTINSINFYRHKCYNIREPYIVREKVFDNVPGRAGGGYIDVTKYNNFTELTVQFIINNSGPAHTAGLKYTTTYWQTAGTITAYFLTHSDNREIWEAKIRISGDWATFEYVIYAEDHLANNDIKKIYYNNDGHGCRIQASDSTDWINNPNSI